MENKTVYEKFPIWIPSVPWAVSLSIYAIGVYILLKFAVFLAVLYILFCVWVEFEVLKESCVNCYYYGRTCSLGRGKLCAFIFKKGTAENFVDREISWKDIAPRFLSFCCTPCWRNHILNRRLYIAYIGAFGGTDYSLARWKRVTEGSINLQALQAEETWLPCRAAIWQAQPQRKTLCE